VELGTLLPVYLGNPLADFQPWLFTLLHALPVLILATIAVGKQRRVAGAGMMIYGVMMFLLVLAEFLRARALYESVLLPLGGVTFLGLVSLIVIGHQWSTEGARFVEPGRLEHQPGGWRSDRRAWVRSQVPTSRSTMRRTAMLLALLVVIVDVGFHVVDEVRLADDVGSVFELGISAWLSRLSVTLAFVLPWFVGAVLLLRRRRALGAAVLVPAAVLLLPSVLILVRRGIDLSGGASASAWADVIGSAATWSLAIAAGGVAWLARPRGGLRDGAPGRGNAYVILAFMAWLPTILASTQFVPPGAPGTPQVARHFYEFLWETTSGLATVAGVSESLLVGLLPGRRPDPAAGPRGCAGVGRGRAGPHPGGADPAERRRAGVRDPDAGGRPRSGRLGRYRRDRRSVGRQRGPAREEPHRHDARSEGSPDAADEQGGLPRSPRRPGDRRQ
jgi:hypothetical protein